MQLQPAEDKCIVKIHDIYDEVTDIFIPEPSRLFAQQGWKGTVIATGPGYLHEVKDKQGNFLHIKRIPMTVQVGDTVLLPAHSSNLFQMFDDKTVFVRERDLYAVVTDSDQPIEMSRKPMYEYAEPQGESLGGAVTP
jgi:co-chaperonin GroES (HSP10)